MPPSNLYGRDRHHAWRFATEDAEPAPASAPKPPPKPGKRPATARRVVVPLMQMDSATPATASTGDQPMSATVILDGKSYAVDPAVARRIEGLEGENAALRHILGDRNAAAEAAAASARQAQAALIADEQRRRDPNTSWGKMVQDQENAWRTPNARG